MQIETMQIRRFNSESIKWEIQFGNPKTENTSRTNNTRTTQIETYKSEKQIESNRIRKVQVEKYTAGDAIRKTQIGNYNP